MLVYQVVFDFVHSVLSQVKDDILVLSGRQSVVNVGAPKED